MDAEIACSSAGGSGRPSGIEGSVRGLGLRVAERRAATDEAQRARASHIGQPQPPPRGRRVVPPRRRVAAAAIAAID